MSDPPVRMQAGSPPTTMRQIVALALFGCVLSIGMHWRLVTNIGAVTADSLDRYFQSWQIAWIGHAAKSHPGSIVDSNTFWPLDNSLAFSDALYGYAPAGMIGSGPGAAMIRYNLLFLFSYALAFLGAALLARELGLSWTASGLAGTAFAFAPWRIAHLNHLHVLSSGGIPLSLALLIRGYRKASPSLVFGGWAVAAWQLSLGFTLGLQLAYLMAVLAAVSLVRWFARGKPRLIGRSVAFASVAGVVLFAGVGVAAGLPLLEVAREFPESRRPPEAVAFFSPPPSAFLAAFGDSVIWGEVTASVRERLRFPPEMSLFPGLTLILLAAAGLGSPVLPVRWRVGLGLGVVVSGTLCLGFSVAGGAIYRLLYDYAPGWEGSRTPGRLFTLTSLGLALAGAAGAEGARRLAQRAGGRLLPGVVVVLLLSGVVLAEGKAKIAVADLPVSPVDFARVPEPQLHLPSDANDPLFMLWSTDGFPRIFNGYAGFVPDAQSRLRDRVNSFPDADSVRLLASVGFRSVVVHVDRLAGTPWEQVPVRSIERLPLERRVGGGFIVYTLRPPP